MADVHTIHNTKRRGVISDQRLSTRAAKADILPQWTQRVVTDFGGRDPLGLSRVGQLFTELMLPGITTTTDRARYYALYCWILWHIQQEERPVTSEAFAIAFQRREAVVALATLIRDSDASPVGKRVVTRRLAQGRDQGEINTAFQVLPSNRLGGFGQYYAGGLYQLGLTHRLDDGIDRVTEGMAEHLARAVHRSLAQTPYLRSRLFAQSVVSLELLEQSSERLGLDAITQSFATDERRLLCELLFGFHEDILHDATRHRRHSLARLLATVSAYEAADIVLDGESLVEQLVYGPTYFGALIDEQGRSQPFTPPALLQRCSEFWRQFCLHQFLTQAFEGLLQAVLEVIAARSENATLDAIMGELLDNDFIQYFEVVLNARCWTPYELLRALGVSKLPDETACLTFRQRYPYHHPLSEWIWYREAKTPAELTARSCLLLAVLYGKWRGVSRDITYAAVAERAGAEIAAPTVLPHLDSWLDADYRWETALHMLVTRILQQHDQVMYSKGRLESCWLHIEDDRLVWDQDYEPTFRASRHDQATQILVDTGLLTWTPTRNGSGSHHLTITEQGQGVLRRVFSEAI